jgi:hypothetical protein
VGPGDNLGLLLAVRARLASISPAWSGWIAPGRIGFMSTQRRDGRWAPTTETGRRSMRHGSRLAQSMDYANRSKQANAAPRTWVSPASASGRTVRPAHLPAMAARSTLQQDIRNQQRARFLCPGSPPVRQAAALRPFIYIGYPPIPSPAVLARAHSTLPYVPAAFERFQNLRALLRVVDGGVSLRKTPLGTTDPGYGNSGIAVGCRTERYDGKGNLYLQHTA